MRTLVWDKTFVKSLKMTIRKNPKNKRIIEDELKDLENNPFAPSLETHKLKGKL